MGIVYKLNDIEEQIINLIHAEIESMKKITKHIEKTGGWKPLCHGDTSKIPSGVEVGIGKHSKNRAIANKDFHIEISKNGTLIVHDKNNEYTIIDDTKKREEAIRAIYNTIPDDFKEPEETPTTVAAIPQPTPVIPEPTPDIPATDAVSSINTQARVTSQPSDVQLSFENEIAALTTYKAKIQSDNSLDDAKKAAITNAIDDLEAALKDDCENYPQLLYGNKGYIKGMDYRESSIIKLYAEYAVACMERKHEGLIGKSASRVVNHPDYHLLSERSRFAFAKVAAAGFIIGLIAVGAVVALAVNIPEVATFMSAVVNVFAEGMKGYGIGFGGNPTLNTANLMVSTVVAGTAVGAVVGYSRQKPLSANDIHGKSLDAAMVASRPNL